MEDMLINIPWIRKGNRRLQIAIVEFVDKNQSLVRCGLLICNTIAIVDCL